VAEVAALTPADHQTGVAAPVGLQAR